MMFASSWMKAQGVAATGRSSRALALLLCLSAVTACKASVSADAKASSDGEASAEGDANFDAEGESDSAWDMTEDTQSEAETAETAQPTRAQGPAAASQAQPPALLGARHDLLLAEGSKENCKCLAVVLGQANAPAFIWTGRRPTVDPSSQLVVALASEGIECSDAKSGASYQGYEVVNGDVIVRVEPAVAGRPVTHGAIIPRPDASHQVYIQPTKGGVHGKSLSGDARCAMGNGS